MGTYDAASGGTGSSDRVAESLRRMQARDAEQRLMAFLDELDEFNAAARAHDVEDGLDPDVVAMLDTITGADDAPWEFRQLHRRVEQGTLTWEQFWLAPEQEPGGERLVNEAVQAVGRELDGLLRGIAEQAADERVR